MKSFLAPKPSDTLTMPMLLATTALLAVVGGLLPHPLTGLAPQRNAAEKIYGAAFTFPEKGPFADGSAPASFVPILSRYVQSDPLGMAATTPGSRTTYAYAGNNPLTNTDPSGLDIVVGGGLHQAVGTTNSQWTYGQSFRPQDINLPLIGPFSFSPVAPGKVYVDTGDIDPNNVSQRFVTTSDEDAWADAYLQQQLGPHSEYSAFGSNCRDYSQGQYNTLVSYTQQMRQLQMSFPINGTPLPPSPAPLETPIPVLAVY